MLETGLLALPETDISDKYSKSFGLDQLFTKCNIIRPSAGYPYVSASSVLAVP